MTFENKLSVDDREKRIIDDLTALIRFHQSMQSNEERFPDARSATMDDTIKFHKEQAFQLRAVRMHLENLFTRVCS